MPASSHAWRMVVPGSTRTGTPSTNTSTKPSSAGSVYMRAATVVGCSSSDPSHEGSQQARRCKGKKKQRVSSDRHRHTDKDADTETYTHARTKTQTQTHRRTKWANSCCPAKASRGSTKHGCSWLLLKTKQGGGERRARDGEERGVRLCGWMDCWVAGSGAVLVFCGGVAKSKHCVFWCLGLARGVFKWGVVYI